MPDPHSGVVEAPDEALVELARAGDADAREELFRRGREIAFRVAFRLLGNAEDAMDAVQDGFIKAFRNLDAFDGRSAFRTWLLRIVTNAAHDLGRRKRRRPALRLADLDTDSGGSGPPGSSVAEPSIEDDPSQGLHRDDLRRALDEALARLSPTIRETFVLFAEAELSYKEIADAQGVPIGTVMSRLYYARQKLQAILEGIEASP
ncbi:RNA polymerase sigma factor [Tautonia rosea]|uniref:RNA polymerase sigma factor n=1 Tax=Tautonia rosea TaxID=2728037 RepID=UPI001473695C|nr:sigma-70 family RNA polymerase sigma factor [Tautonia rosea]